MKVLATKCWPLKRSSSFKVIISIIGKNNSTRNFVSASMIGSSVASSSKNLGTLLVLFSTRETGSPYLRARIEDFFRIFFHWPLISLIEFSALPNSDDDLPRSISNACRSLDTRLIAVRIFSQMISKRRNSRVPIFFSRSLASDFSLLSHPLLYCFRRLRMSGNLFFILPILSILDDQRVVQRFLRDNGLSLSLTSTQPSFLKSADLLMVLLKKLNVSASTPKTLTQQHHSQLN